VRFVLDNSVTMRWLFGDGTHSDQVYARQVLDSIEDGNVIVPNIWCLEVANVIVRAESKYNLSEARSTEFIYLLQQMQLQIDTQSNMSSMNTILQLSRRYNLSSYDCSYLELAIREGIPLATLDDGLIKASKKAGIERFSLKNKTTKSK
jgi:predicted nucleic acid-binding protein